METFTRLLSWAFVFGALATLLTTSLRPVWKDLMAVDVNVEQVQGSSSLPAPIDSQDRPLTAHRDCPDTVVDTAPEGCPERLP